MTGRDEELALERIRLQELRDERLRAWCGRRYVEAHAIEAEIRDAESYIRRLEEGR